MLMIAKRIQRKVDELNRKRDAINAEAKRKHAQFVDKLLAAFADDALFRQLHASDSWPWFLHHLMNSCGLDLKSIRARLEQLQLVE